uniref:Putative lipocalin lipocalin n=1 Tax=Ixodes ricinus TaxID=34613 RepID=A0A6B0UX70_IXORI
MNDNPVHSILLSWDPFPPPEQKFLETFKDGYVALTSFYNNDACTLLNRTTLSNDNTMAEYVVMARKRDQTNLTTYNVSFKAEACSSKVDITYADNNVMHITLAYAQYGKCAVFQDDSNLDECVLYAYTDTTDDEFNACSEHFPSNCDKELWRSLGPQQCKDG